MINVRRWRWLVWLLCGQSENSFVIKPSVWARRRFDSEMFCAPAERTNVASVPGCVCNYCMTKVVLYCMNLVVPLHWRI